MTDKEKVLKECPKCVGCGEQWFHGSRIHGGPSYIGKCTTCNGEGKVTADVASRIEKESHEQPKH